MPKNIDDSMDMDDLNTEGFEDEEPIPIKRDIRIFHRKMDDDKKEDKKKDKKEDDDFEEDVFV
jgi:hypothetical protein